MFSEIFGFISDLVQDIIICLLSNSLLSYIFYLSVLMLIVGVIQFILSFNNTDK